MVINKPITTGDVKFISYTGKYPALCCGALTLEIDGEIVEFGSGKRYGSFWHTGGECWCKSSRSYCDRDEWIIDYNEIPPIYREFADEINEVFNDNVEWGCCGGCR